MCQTYNPDNPLNFLGHIYLSGATSKVMVGNFLGDFVRKSQIEDWDEELTEGFYLHHEIDRYTDTHPIVKQSKARLLPKYRHYSGVIIDIFYDHYLAKNWSRYSEADLKTYTKSTYEFLEIHKSIFPERAIKTLKYMSSMDWLYNYQYIDGIEMALKGMARRAKFDSKMDLSIHDLKQDYKLYEDEFDTFFPDIIKHLSTTNKYI